MKCYIGNPMNPKYLNRLTQKKPYRLFTRIKSSVIKASWIALMCAAIGIVIHYSTKVEPRKENIPHTEQVSLEDESYKQGKTYYVSPDGDDLNTGTRESPFKTVSDAIKLTKAGDTVIMLRYAGQVPT